MEMIENPMVLPECKYKHDSIPDDVWADMEDAAYDDYIFEEEI